MAIVVIGGQSKDIGKTGVVCGLISAMPERRWTAIKISVGRHEPGGGTLADRAIAITEEHNAAGGTDSCRYLAAGAVRSLWIRIAEGRLAEAMPRVLAEMASAQNVILESNSIVGYLQPDLYAIVLDPRIADFKASARGYLDRADAILLRGTTMDMSNWSGGSPKPIERKPEFHIAPPDYRSAEFSSFVARKLERAGK